MKVLISSFSSNEFIENRKINNMKHIKNSLYRAWVGLAWECLINNDKNSLKKILDNAILTNFELFTVLSKTQKCYKFTSVSL